MSFLSEWLLPLHGLLISCNLVQGVRHARIWRRATPAVCPADRTRAALPLSHALASILISCWVLASRGSSDGPAAVLGASCIALALALVAPLTRRPPPRRMTLALQKAHLDWPIALAGHALAGATVVIAALWVSPSPLTGQLAGDGLRWGLLDKRWVVASYTLAVSLIVVLPIFLRRGFELVGLQPVISTTGEVKPAENPRPWRFVFITLGHLLLSAALAIWFFAGTFTTPPPILDLHELVHLGSLQGIRQGLLPYLEAETQYGPGHQLLTYHMMERTNFSLRGFRLSHLLTNLVAMALVYFCYLRIFTIRTAALLIAVSLWISPTAYFELYGWTVIPRWLGPVLTGLLLPTIIAHQHRPTPRRLSSFLLGALSGLLAWMASENLFGSIITFTLASVLFWSIRAVTTRALIEIAACWFIGLAGALTISFLSIFEPGQISSVMELYFRASGMVSSGLSNTGWGRAWNTWAWPYFLTPYLLIAASLVVIYPPEIFGLERRRQLVRVRLIGLLAAAIVLQMVTLFRTDTVHLLGPSLALGAVVALAIIDLPELAARRRRIRGRIRGAILLGVLLVYPISDLVAGWRQRLPLHWMEIEAVADFLGDLQTGEAQTPSQPTPASPDAARRLGWAADPNEIASHETQLTYGEWLALMDHISEYVDGRKTVVSKFEDVFPSAVYFFSDLQVVLAVEPMMSVWTGDDVKRWKANLAAREVDCLITSGGDDLVMESVLTAFRRYSTHRVEQPIPFEIHCRE